MSLLNLVKITIFFLTLTQAYKQFKLARKSLANYLDIHCYNQNFSSVEQKYEELCYQKDISYNLQLNIDDIAYYVSLDLTIPYTWFKSPQCVLQRSSKGCSIIHDKQKHKISKQFHQSKSKFTFFSQQMLDDQQNSVAVYGSTNLVLGNVQTIKKGEFSVKNSQNMRDLFKLFGISLFLLSQTQSIELSNYNFIKATKLSYDLNALSDGSLSLVNSNNSAINNIFYELLKKQEDNKKIISIYINAKAKKGVFAFGEMSLKYTTTHKNQIKWIPLNSSPTGHKCNTLSFLLIKQRTDQSTFQISFTDQQPIDTYFSISTSNIHLPSYMIQYIKQQLATISKASCKFNQNHLLQCKWKTIQHKRQVLFLYIYFKMKDETILKIPFTTLINMSHDLIMEFTIKLSESNIIILGEPFFEQYIVYIDFQMNGNSIGFAPSYSHNPDFLATMVIYILRVILFTFLGLIIIYIFFNPLYQYYHKFKQSLRKWKRKKVKVDETKSRYQTIPQQQLS